MDVYKFCQCSTEIPELAVIYAIIRKCDGKKYIGETNNLRTRFARHRTELRGRYHHNKYLENAFHEYGEDAFIIIVLEIIYDLNKLKEREQYHANILSGGNYKKHLFNFGEFTDNPFRGQKHTEITKKKISKSNKGKNRHTKEGIERIRVALKGKKLSNERVRKIKDGAKIAHEKEKKEIKLVSPWGELIVRKGIRVLCREFGLGKSGVMFVLNGKITHYKGWRLPPENGILEPFDGIRRHVKNPEILSEKIRRARLGKSSAKKWDILYLIKDGIVYATNRLNKFAKDMKIPAVSLSHLANHKRIDYKGWQLYIFDPANPPQNVITKDYSKS